MRGVPSCDVSDITRDNGLRLLIAPDHPSGGCGERCLLLECNVDGLRVSLGLEAVVSSTGEGTCGDDSSGNLKLLNAEASCFSALDDFLRLDCLPSCGVFPADAVPGRLLAGRTGNGCPDVPFSSVGVVASYSGDGWRGDSMPKAAGDCPPRLDVYCRLALRPWPFIGLLPGPLCMTGALPSLIVSLPSDMIDRLRPWPLSGLEALMGVLAD